MLRNIIILHKEMHEQLLNIIREKNISEKLIVTDNESVFPLGLTMAS